MKSVERDRLLAWSFPGLLLVYAGATVLLPFRDAWFTNAAAHDQVAFKAVLSWAALALALGIAVVPRLRIAVERSFTLADALPPRARAAWLCAASSAVIVHALFIKYGQYRSFQLPQDSAAVANIAYNIVTRGSSESVVFGVSSLYAIHFMPAFFLQAPLVLLGTGALSLLLWQQALLATVPPALFLLARGAGAGSMGGAAVFLLGWSSPFLRSLYGASATPQVALPVFFLWAMVFFAYGRRRLGLAAIFLMMGSIEQAPFTSFGLGLILAVQGRRRLGAAVCLTSVALFVAEMKFIYSFPDAGVFRDWAAMFGNLGPDPVSAARAALSSPLAFAARMVWPPERLEPLWRMFATTAFLPLLSPICLLPWAVNYLPNFLAPSGTFYHDLVVHYPAYVVGPLWWAAARGAARFEGRWGAGCLMAAALAGAGLGWRLPPGLLTPDRARLEFQDGPAAAALIPKDAPVWASEYFSPWLAARTYIKSIPQRDDPMFERWLFLPDYIVLAKGLIVYGDPAFRRRIAALIKTEGYRRVREFPSILVFRHPRAPLAPSGEPPPKLVLPLGMPGIDFSVQIEPGN